MRMSVVRLAALACWAAALSATVAAAAPPNLFEVKDALKAYVDSRQYMNEIAAQVADARAYLDTHVAGTAKPAIVLDIDETSLSNIEEIEANDYAYLPGWYCQPSPLGFCGALAWDALERATAVAPTLALFDDAKAKGVAVIFITGRHEAERDATEGNLRKAGYAGWAKLVMRPDNGPRTTALEYKSAARRALEQNDGYHIIVNVGDQQSDIDGGSAEHPVKLPNPFYVVQ